MDSKLKTIRGVNVANIILLSIVVAFALGLGLICNVGLSKILEQSELRTQIINTIATDPSAANYTVEQIIGMVSGILWAFVAAYVIFCGLMIAGSAITLSRIKNRPNEIDGCIGWSIMGIILSLLGGLLISLILYIVSTVCISSAKSLVAEGNGIPETSYGATDAPTEPAKISAPTEPVAPAEPATPAQPAPTAPAEAAKVDASAEPAKNDTPTEAAKTDEK